MVEHFRRMLKFQFPSFEVEKEESGSTEGRKQKSGRISLSHIVFLIPELHKRNIESGSA